MQSCIHFNSQDNYFIINDKIKVDPNKIEFLFGKRSLENLIQLEDNLYYYKEKSLIELLFNIMTLMIIDLIT